MKKNTVIMTGDWESNLWGIAVLEHIDLEFVQEYFITKHKIQVEIWMNSRFLLCLADKLD